MISWVLSFSCVGALLLVIVIIVLLTSKPFKYEKRQEGDNTCLTITAMRTIDRVVIVVTENKEKMTFERKRIKKGQKIDFVFPTPKKPIKVIVEMGDNNQRVFEV